MLSNGSVNQVVQYYFKNGEIESEFTYQNGEFNQLCKGWYQDGKLSFEGTWLKGRKHGIWSDYDKEGNVTHEYWFNGREIKLNPDNVGSMSTFLKNFNSNTQSALFLPSISIQ